MHRQLLEVMPKMFTQSEVLVMDFSNITQENDEHKNIKKCMAEQAAAGIDLHDACHRQKFNDYALDHTPGRYLIGQYGENRTDILRHDSHMVGEGRVYHLAIDIYSKVQEPVFAPCDGQIVASSYEPGLHNYGNYIIIRPNDSTLPYIFFGHLAQEKLGLGQVSAGQQIGRLGTFHHLENGGWSIHLHLQLLAELPPEGEAPIGYSTRANMQYNQKRFPDPQSIFPSWKIKR